MNGERQTREIFRTGLKGAHTLENQALSGMTPQVKRIEKRLDMAAKVQEHILKQKA